MKVKLEFNLPEEKSEFKIAFQGIDYKCILWDFDQHLRNTIKYNSKDLTPIQLNAYEKIREELHEIYDDYNINIYDW